MTIIKRDRRSSSEDLVGAIDQFCTLLAAQNEDEAIAALVEAAQTLKQAEPASAEHRAAISAIVDAFEGEHELSAYILENADPNKWDEPEQLSQAATRVLTLARRLR